MRLLAILADALSNARGGCSPTEWRRVREDHVHDCVPLADVYLEWEPFAEARDGLMLWEAFVTRGAKGATDEEDATIGLDAFCAQLPTPGDADANETQRPLSLAAAAPMWAGWDLPPDALRAACVLVRA